jgi:ABC-type nickel/cobalt efflux system permease component RcnA
MKKTLSILMITLLVSPVFATWLPEDVILSLHKNNLEHFVTGTHSHSDHQHGHEHSPSEHSQQEHRHKNKSNDSNQDTYELKTKDMAAA